MASGESSSRFLSGGVTGAGPPHPDGGVFVGRQAELAMLRAAAEEVLRGHGRLALLAGEAGIGKTRTAQEFATFAQERNMQVLWGRGYEGGGAPAYWPWEQVLRAHVRGLTPQSLLAEMGPGAADIAQVSRAVRDHLPDLPPPPRLAPEQERFRFFESVATFIRNAACKRAMAVIVDDLHWVEPSSLLLLQFLARELADAPVLVLGTYRDDEVERGNPLSKTIVELARIGTIRRMALRGLSAAEVRHYIAQVAECEPAATMVDAVWQQTEGNPFFLGEVVRLLAAEGRLTSAAAGRVGRLAVPAAVREVIGRRLERVSLECNHLLAVGAVVGRHFSLELLERVTQLPRARIVELLDEAAAARILVEAPEAVARYGFAHALIRETLYGELLASRRLRLHQQVGEGLELLYARNLEPVLGEIAYHFGEAAPIGDVRKAIHYARRAAERAAAQFAHEDAATYYERALSLLAAEDQANEVDRGEMLLALARARRCAGQIEEQRATILQAAAVARQIGDHELLARVALANEGDRPRGGQVEDEIFSPLLEEACVALRSDDSPLRARLLAQRAMWQLRPEVRARGMTMSRESVAIARRLDDASTLARVVYPASFALYAPGNLEERLALTAEAVSLADRIRDRALAVNARFMRIWSLLELGDVASLSRELEVCARLAEEVREPGKLLTVSQLHAMHAELMGRFDEAEAHGRRSLAIAQRMQGEPLEAAVQIFAALMFDLRRQQGRMAEVETSVAAFAAQGDVPAWRAAVALAYSELGRSEAAQREVESLARHDFADLPADWLWLSTLSLLVDVREVRCDTRRVGLLYQLLQPYAGRCVVVGDGSAVCLGAVSRSLGVLAGAMQRWEAACEHFEDALALHARMGARPWLAHTQHNYAAMLLDRGKPGDPAKALALLSAAIDTAEEIGMAALLERALPLKLKAEEDASGDAENSIDVVATAARNLRPALAAGVGDMGPPSPDTACLHREGDYWTLVHDGVIGRLKDTKGLRYLAQLLAHPDREFHVLDLMQMQTSGVRGQGRGVEEIEDRRPGTGSQGLEMLDATAKSAYRNRLRELREELAEAEQDSDLGRAERVRAEVEAITEQLAAAVGLGGRDRQAASNAERARSTVTQRIRAVIKKIGTRHPSLAEHLAARVRTGTFCAYQPDRARAIVWDL